MNWIKSFRYSGYDDAVYLTYELVRFMNAKVSIESVERDLMQHPSYPSLLAISDTLNTFGIEHVTARIPFDSLMKLPAPWLAVVSNHLAYEEPVLVRKVQGNYLEIMRSSDRTVTFTEVSSFQKDYMGIALLPNEGNEFTENEYDKKVKDGNKKLLTLITALFIIPVVILAFVILSLFSFGTASAPVVSFTLVTFVGWLVSCILAFYDQNQGDRLLKMFCVAGKNVDCDAVINSSASKILGVSWSAIGFTFFAGELLMLLFLQGSSIPWQYALGCFSVMAVPYPIFSIFYQRFVVKQWCTLCLVVQASIISQFIIAYFFHWIDAGAFFHAIITFPLAAVTMFTAFAIPAIFFYFTVPNITIRRRMNQYQSQFQRLKHHPVVFDALLNAQHAVDFSICRKAIDIGNNDSPVKLLMICSPFCKPCARAHAVLHSLLDAGFSFHLHIIFLTNISGKENEKQVAGHLLAACAEQPHTEREKILHAWFSQDDFDFDSFVQRFPIGYDTSEFNSSLDDMARWCTQANVAATPTLFVNGTRLPESYYADDIKYYLINN